VSVVVETYRVGLVVEECIACGVIFGITSAYRKERMNDHRNFSCPNGHSQHWPQESDAEKFKRLYNEAEDRRAQTQAEADQLAASLSATKGVVTKQRRKLARVSQGVCPCCNRSFRNVKRHMKTMHPDYSGQPQ